MAISKLILNGVTQMDVTDTTATVSDVASGKVFTQVDGTTGTGTASGGGGASVDDIAQNLEPSGAITLGSGVTRIYERAFSYKPISSIIAPSVTQVDGSALEYTQITELTDVSFPSLTTLGIGCFENMKSLKRVYFTNNINLAVLYIFRGADNLKVFRLPNTTSATSQQLVGSAYELLIADMGSVAKLSSNVFYRCRKMQTLILRSTALVGLDNITAFVDTPMRGYNSLTGTVYIPETLYNHLGDGTSLDYQAATNWSTIYANGYLNFAKIEGSPYEQTDWDDSGFLT